MSALRYMTVCSGIEAPSVAWHGLGWQPVLFSEIEAFPRAVLRHHYPDVKLLGDFTCIDAGECSDADLLCGGTPCQAFSIAGQRAGLEDARGNLTLAFVELADAIDADRRSRGEPGIIVLWENVPGVLSMPDNAFGCFLAALVGADTALVPPGGRKWTDAGMVAGPRRRAAWRLFDAQYLGLAQRRERVFVVACPADGPDPSAILFECEGRRRHSPPRREAGKKAARPIAAGPAGSSGYRNDADTADTLICHAIAYGGNNTAGPIDVATARTASASGPLDFETETFIVEAVQPIAFPAQLSGTQCAAATNISPALSVAHSMAVAYSITPSNSNRDYNARATGHAQALTGSGGRPSARGGDVVVQSAVRRLLPLECERLQGFPDGYTMIPWRGKPAEDCPDGPRYSALGNSMAVTVMAWIGRRIDAAWRQWRGYDAGA